MRPIWMKIKGLNSFLEAQEVDFQQLTSQGLFGIFGPTGSGKSSILDGMSLALYGTTARNSTNFINVNTDRASVDYIFSVKETRERRYCVSRSFKRSKEGAIRSDGAKFIEIIGDKQEILADRVGAVNEKCKEVLGLSKEDFFRTVVLPQGKFSEFLKLEGMERNKMLERLFHLEQYGEQLAAMVKSRVNQWEGRKLEKEGALSRYHQANEEQIEELLNREKTIGAELTEKEEKKKKVQIALEEAKVIAAYQEEYQRFLQEGKRLLEQAEAMQTLEEKVKKSELANKLFIYLQNAREGQKLALESQKKEEESRQELEEKQQCFAQTELGKKEAEEKLQETKPELQLQIELLNQAMELEEKRLQEKAVLHSLEAKQAEAMEKLQDSEEKMKNLLLKIEQVRSQKELLVEELQKISIPAQTLQMAANGAQMEKALKKLNQQIKQQIERRNALEKDLKLCEEKRKEISLKKADCQKNFADVEGELSELKKQLEKLQSLEEEKERLFYLQERCEKIEELQKKFQEQEIALGEKKSAYKEACQRKEKVETEKKTTDALYLEHMADILASKLQEGAPCPVCGSVHHKREASLVKAEDIEALVLKKQEAEQEFQKALAEASALEISVKHMEELQIAVEKERKELEKENPQKELEITKASYEKKIQEKQEIQKEVERKTVIFEKNQSAFYDLQNEETRLQTIIKNGFSQIQEKREEIEKLSEEQKHSAKDLDEIKKKLSAEDIGSFYEEIQVKVKVQEKLQTQKSQLEDWIESRVKNSEKGKEIIENLRNHVLQLKLSIEESKKKLDEFKEQIVKRAGTTENIKEKQNTLKQQLSHLEQAYNQLKERWEKLQREEQQLREIYTQRKTKSEAAREQAKEKQECLQSEMAAAGIKEDSWIEENQMDATVLQDENNALKSYNAAVERNTVQTEQAKERLGERCVAKGQLQALEEEIEGLEFAIREQQKLFGALKQEREQAQKDWEEKKKIIQELEAVNHKLDILTELEGLFRGKRFVEYVSRYYLEYVSREADQQLRQMTSNSYGLETDGNGMFLIRDYKNGGALRSASTLSGGETFMASLALALALSSQIQMKGTAPLELFFLDEGFGTLDETYLEIVMESLENIRTKRRSVGVITHVEEIKNRIPVRLLVEPARMGEGGSKIRIEEE